MKKFLVATFLFLSNIALGYTVETKPGTQIFLSVPEAGKATVEFSESVEWVSGSQRFQIQAIGAELDERSRRALNPQVFEVTPTALGAEEAVTFVFGKRDGGPRTLVIRFRTKAQASAYYRVKLAAASASSEFRGFLADEAKLMRAMLSDEVANAREVISLDVKLAPETNISAKAIRRFERSKLRGFVFEIENISKNEVELQSADFQFGPSSTAVLSHLDNFKLPSCKVDEKRCRARLSVVVRSDAEASDLVFSPRPFPISENKEGERL